MNEIEIAEVCHEVNRGICFAMGDLSQQSWAQAPEWQRKSAIAGVKFAIDNPEAPDSAQHDAWCKDKVANGWVFGPVKDSGKKTHPCLVPFEQLPKMQQLKDVLFKTVVKTLGGGQ